VNSGKDYARSVLLGKLYSEAFDPANANSRGDIVAKHYEWNKYAKQMLVNKL